MDHPNTAHDNDLQAKHFAPHGWRVHKEDDNSPYRDAHHSCSYCGSIRVDELLGFLRSGARLDLADMKYGYPHKIYVSEVPNVKAGEKYNSYVTCSSNPGEEGWEEYDTKRYDEHTGKPIFAWRRLNAVYDCPDTRQVKFYTSHLSDATPEQLAELNTFFFSHLALDFSKDAEGRLMFATYGRRA